MKKYTLTFILILAGLALFIIPLQVSGQLEDVTNFTGVHIRNSSFGTATPALLVQTGGNGNALEIRNSSGTPVSSISGAGVLSGFGSSGLSVAPNLVVAAPTGVGTATPVALLNSAGGVSNLFEVRAASTPVYRAEADGDHQFNNGATTLNATQFDLNDTLLNQDLNTENLGVPTVISSTVSCATAAGCTGTIATIGDGEIWFVHSVFVRTIVDFDCTGDDCTLIVGDSDDPNGFIAAADASIQAAFTEATGYAPGWYGIEAGSGGAYTLDDGGPFVYAPSGGTDAITYVFDSTGDDMSAGTIIFYVVYTRIL